MQSTVPKFLETRVLNVDQAFVDRVLSTSLLVCLGGILVLWSLAGLGLLAESVALGFAVGSLVSIGGIGVLKWSVHRLLGGEAKDKRSAFAVQVLLIKLPLILAILVVAIHTLSVNLVALLVGLGLTQIVMLLKLGGIFWVHRMNAAKESSAPPERARA